MSDDTTLKSRRALVRKASLFALLAPAAMLAACASEPPPPPPAPVAAPPPPPPAPAPAPRRARG
ncbi:hypothetical protein [Falsiroseomonas sp. HW251]|uniref:hypothetical protein n=1 Tax=Falsiroseomonas sp. HW251 TaxID=3390998 RepID=UPI003D3224C3